MGTQTTRRIRGGHKLAGLAAVLGLGLVLAAPAAHARNEFANGFEDQLGRIVAVETVRLGGFLLGGAAYGPPAAYVAPTPVYYGSYRYGYDDYGYDYDYERPRRHWHKKHRHHHRKHRHHDHCGHGRFGQRGHWRD